MFMVVVAVRRVGMIASTCASVSGAVATMKLPTGISRRRRNIGPPRLGPVASSTCFASTVPRAVVTRCAAPPPSRVRPVTGAFSKMRAPRRAAAAASPAPKRPMCICALLR